MGGVLQLDWSGVLKLLECLLDISLHGDIQYSGLVVTVQCDATVETSCHLYERHAHSLNYPTVLKKGPQFFFHCASKDVSHGHKFNTNWSIVGRLIEGGHVGIC